MTTINHIIDAIPNVAYGMAVIIGLLLLPVAERLWRAEEQTTQTGPLTKFFTDESLS